MRCRTIQVVGEVMSVGVEFLELDRDGIREVVRSEGNLSERRSDEGRLPPLDAEIVLH